MSLHLEPSSIQQSTKCTTMEITAVESSTSMAQGGADHVMHPEIKIAWRTHSSEIPNSFWSTHSSENSEHNLVKEKVHHCEHEPSLRLPSVSQSGRLHQTTGLARTITCMLRRN